MEPEFNVFVGCDTEGTPCIYVQRDWKYLDEDELQTLIWRLLKELRNERPVEVIDLEKGLRVSIYESRAERFAAEPDGRWFQDGVIGFPCDRVRLRSLTEGMDPYKAEVVEHELRTLGKMA